MRSTRILFVIFAAICIASLLGLEALAQTGRDRVFERDGSRLYGQLNSVDATHIGLSGKIIERSQVKMIVFTGGTVPIPAQSLASGASTTDSVIMRDGSRSYGKVSLVTANSVVQNGAQLRRTDVEVIEFDVSSPGDNETVNPQTANAPASVDKPQLTFATRSDLPGLQTQGRLQGQLISIGILSFQDESGMNAPAELGQKLARDLQQKLTANYKDILPRVIAADSEASSGKALSLEQITALGKQNGMKFVVRGGLLAVTSENAGEEIKTNVQLYADVVSVEPTTVSSVRAEGAGIQKRTTADATVQLSSIDFRSSKFRLSALGKASSNAIEQLAVLVHQSLVSPPQVATDEQPQTSPSGNENETQTETPESEAAKLAETDDELQQLIGQAEATLSSTPNASTEDLNSLRQALEGLKSALDSKANLLEQSKDTGQADQEIAGRKDELQSALTKITEQAASNHVGTEQPTVEREGLLARINKFADGALSLMQKIQEIRAALRGMRNDPSSGSDSGSASTVSENSSPSEEPLQQVDGTVTQDGNAVEGAVVSDEESGASTTTDSNGTYTLKGLPTGRLAHLVVTRSGKPIARGQVDLLRGRSALADFQVKTTSATATGTGVLPSTVVIRPTKSPSTNAGALKGAVRDTQGKPVPFALVNLKGLGMARTNALGQYMFMNVPAGNHELIVSKSGMRLKTQQAQVTVEGSESTIQFAPSDRIAKPFSGSLILPGAGTVLSGRVVDSDNHPLAGAKVSLIQAQAAISVFSGPGGTYKFGDLKAGPYKVSVFKVGYSVATQTLDLRSGATERRDLQLQRTTSPLINSVIKNALASQGEIRGRVRGANGVSIANASIEFRAAGKPSVIATTRTDTKGDYTLRLREGTYEVRVGKQSFQQAWRTVAVRPGDSIRADFENRDQTPPIERRKGQLTGRVSDSRTGAPIQGAMVSISGQRSLSTGADGSFAFANLAAGTYQVSVSKNGFTNDGRSVAIRGGETATASFKLSSNSRPPIRVPGGLKRK